jgi:hypothetical protein
VNVKVFAATEPHDLEVAIHDWLTQNPGVGIVTTAQSADPAGRTILTVFYAEARTQPVGGSRRRS